MAAIGLALFALGSVTDRTAVPVAAAPVTSALQASVPKPNAGTLKLAPSGMSITIGNAIEMTFDAFANMEHPDRAQRPVLQIDYVIPQRQQILTPQERHEPNGIVLRFDLSTLPADAVVHEATLRNGAGRQRRQPTRTRSRPARSSGGTSTSI